MKCRVTRQHHLTSLDWAEEESDGQVCPFLKPYDGTLPKCEWAEISWIYLINKKIKNKSPRNPGHENWFI